MKPLILDEDQIHHYAQMTPAALQAVAEGFVQLSAENVTLPPILRIDFPEVEGEVDVKSAVIKGWDQFAIKVASGFFNNAALGLPTGNGLMLLLSTQTGQPQAVLLDNGYLTDLRTGLAGALAAQVLAPQKITVGVIGSGMQARFQIRALKLVRSFDALHVYGINSQSVRQYADEMQAELGIPVTIHKYAKDLVQTCNMVITTTPARDGYLKAEWLHPGLHITCMGADAPHKQELEAAAFARADLIACDARQQCARLGELHHALDEGVLPNMASVLELGELLAGSHLGRSDEQQISICDLTGVGVQDTAIARWVVQAYQNQQLNQ